MVGTQWVRDRRLLSYPRSSRLRYPFTGDYPGRLEQVASRSGRLRLSCPDASQS